MPRSDLRSGNRAKQKSLSRGFGVVRLLTPSSQQEVLQNLSNADITPQMLRRVSPMHLTVLGFIGMSKAEQTAFHAGMNVKRLEERLEKGVEESAPRTALSVELGSCAFMGNLVYCSVEDARTHEEQVQLAGQVALHGISIKRIDKRTVPPHVAIGYNQQIPIEDMVEQVGNALLGQTIALQRWDVYPARYA